MKRIALVFVVAALSACSGGGGSGDTPATPEPTPPPTMMDPCDAELRGLIWEDIDADGVRATGELILEGVQLSLLDDIEQSVDTGASTVDGYAFTGLCAGSYRLQVITASNQTVTLQNVGSDDAIDSDIDPISGQTELIPLGESDVLTTTDAGLFNPQTRDSDNDGVADVDDAFPDDPAETVDTDSDGTGDNSDAFPADPNEQLDSDNDGVGDNADPSPQPMAQGVFPANFSALYAAGDSVTTDRPLFNWGDHYAQKIADALGLTLNNEARGGWVLKEILNGRGGLNQLDALYGVPRVADPNALHIVYGGYNDVFFRPDPFRYDVVNESAESLRSVLLEIANAGGRFVLVPLLYDTGRQISSDADGIRAQLRQRTIDFNTAALIVISDVVMATDMSILSYDVFTDVEDIYANPASNGFTNLTTACGDSRANCVGFFWWDDAHPGDDVHQIIADGILQVLIDAR